MIDDVQLTHEEQQQAVEKIQELMQQGMSTAQAIQQVSQQIRKEKGQPLETEA